MNTIASKSSFVGDHEITCCVFSDLNEITNEDICKSIHALLCREVFNSIDLYHLCKNAVQIKNFIIHLALLDKTTILCNATIIKNNRDIIDIRLHIDKNKKANFIILLNGNKLTRELDYGELSKL